MEERTTACLTQHSLDATGRPDSESPRKASADALIDPYLRTIRRRRTPVAQPQIRTERLLSDSEVTYVKDRTIHRLSSLSLLIACLGLFAGVLLPAARPAIASPAPPPIISGGDPDAPGSSTAPHSGEQLPGSGSLSSGQVQGDQTGHGGSVVTPLGTGAVRVQPRPAAKFTSWAGIKGLYVR